MDLGFVRQFLPFAIFPEGGLDASVTTTVWLGVLVLGFCNLRLGWTLSGLVVPGYLVPLLIVEPWSAAVVVVEALAAYLIVRLVSERLPVLGFGGALFGRDRFFAIVLASIGMRLLVDGLLLPHLGNWLFENHRLMFGDRGTPHSFGLIVVALLANQLWKPGLGRGLATFTITTAATWALVRFALIPLTNFKVAGLDYMYEDVAASLLASPKTYIVLVTTAWIASWMNLRYSWEYNGILVPSLIALFLYQPLKILSTVVEAWVVLGLARAALSFGPWRGQSIENGRKLLLFFNLAFLYKLALGHVLAVLAPEVKITDAYGFGYLLATLMAVRMHDKGIAIRLTLSTLGVAAASGVLASMVGFAFTRLMPAAPDALLESARGQRQAILAGFEKAGVNAEARDVERHEGELQTWLLEARERVAERASELYEAPKVEELLWFDQAVLRPLTELARQTPRAAPGDRRWRKMDRAAGAVGYRLSHFQQPATGDGFLILAPAPESSSERKTARAKARQAPADDDQAAPDLAQRARYWGTYVFRLGGGRPFLVQVPHPGLERGTWEYGSALFERFDAEVLLLAGARPDANRDGLADVVRPENTANLFNLVYQVWMREAGKRPLVALQVRGFQADELADVDLLVSTASGALPKERLPGSVVSLLEELEQPELRLRRLDGSPETAGYEATALPQARYLEQLEGKELVALWLGRNARALYRKGAEQRRQLTRLANLGIEGSEGHLVDTLAGPASPRLPREEELSTLATNYLNTDDLVALHLLRKRSELHLESLIDRRSAQLYLLIRGADAGDDTAPALAIHLAPRPGVAISEARFNSGDVAAIRRLVDERRPLLIRRLP